MTAQYPIDTTPEQPFDAKPKKKRRWVTPAIAVGTFALGAIIGSSGASGDTGSPTAEPAEVITETVVETETVTETIEVTPAVCLDAIDSARAGFGVASDLVNVIGPALEAAFYRDITGMEAATADLEVLNAELSQNTFAVEAAACEGAA